ncbi:APC4 protein, partial [Polypterus senegalus]|nr:anaphase-promoting complex subunit 4 [Polypterus senegalus]MBN3290313.1 APC4 protein [Polypterus senegalus]
MPPFRLFGEKQLPTAVIFMVWSPKRDLIALANKAGELLLHRLANFQRVWSLAPNENTGKEISSVAWRPDGKVLAFSLADTSRVVLCDVEKAEVLHCFPVESPVACMHWMEVSEENSNHTSVYSAEDESNLFLTKLPAVPKSYSTTSKIFSEEKSDEIMKLLDDVRLNILVTGGSGNIIEFYAYGMYKIATSCGVPGTCQGLCLSSDLKSLSLITEIKATTNEREIVYLQLDTSLLSDYLPEVTRMARKFTHISTLLQYQKLSLTCMCEAWEDILMQMDLKLTKFVQEKNTTTSVQDEFLELLLWGKASPELQALLINQLTVKGLKKLGQSIESSYSSIQKLVISNLQSGSEALLYHLSELKGMALWKQKYGPIGLDSAKIEDAVTAVGSFILKANELLQVIDRSMKNFKAFFRWLYVAMLRMSEDHVPPELNKMTQKDIAFVADFLSEHFNEAPELYDRKGKYFNVERVGQYLKDEDDDLVSPPNYEGNPWVHFVQNSPHLKESPLLFPCYPTKSLHFVKRVMEGAIDLCLEKPAEIIGKSVKEASCITLYTTTINTSTPRLLELPSLWNEKKSGMHYVVFTMPEISSSKIYIMKRSTDFSRVVTSGLLAIDLGNLLIGNIDDRTDTCCYSCLDARFYDDETLTVVLETAEEDHRERILAQLPLNSVYINEKDFSWDPSQRLDQQSGHIPVQNVVLENQWRALDNMKAHYVAVNGIRRISCVLSSNLRHIRVFEMDVEEEEEDEKQDLQNASADLNQVEESLTSGDGSEVQEDCDTAETPDLQKENDPLLQT